MRFIWPWTFFKVIAEDWNLTQWNFDGGTFRHSKSHGTHFLAVDPFGDLYLADKKLGQCDLIYGLCGPKCSTLKYNVFNYFWHCHLIFKVCVIARGLAHSFRHLRRPLSWRQKIRSVWPHLRTLWTKVHFSHVFQWEKDFSPVWRILAVESN